MVGECCLLAHGEGIVAIKESPTEKSYIDAESAL